MKVEIITPDKKVYVSEDVQSIKLSGIQGQFEVLNNHAPLISVLAAGSVHIKTNDGKSETFYLDTGVTEVLNNQVIVLSEAVLEKKEQGV